MSHERGRGPRVVLITGATGAIGKAIARQIAAQEHYEVVLAARDAGKAERAVTEIRRAAKNERVRFALVDVARKASVQALAARWDGPLHVLINNAGITPRRRQETPERIELQFATNVLGYLWMAQALTDRLAASASSRIVNVASYYAGDLDLSDLEFTRRPYDNNAAYRQSKQADRMLTVALAERLRPLGVAVNACHPGDVSSQLSNNLGFAGSQTADEAARTPVWLATSAAGQTTGKFFEHSREAPDPFARDRQAIEALYQACVRY
ncbi:MAG TPA: SDR family NAD(P)-dependent oxidoreductase [Candidatus Sulfotelmatobacter sp.]|nr:SDR family NAD(P)-dependent oxidoreductase [Candidatus Sulfotelmatobacter sp.]